jgi:hypothetical protein
MPTTPPPADVPPSQLILQLSTGYIVSSALQVVVKLKVADELADGPRTAEDLARATGVQADALYRVLRADAPDRVREMVLWITDPFHYRVYAEVLHSVQTGLPAVDKVYALPVFEHIAREPELSAAFNDAMTAFSASVMPAVLEAYDFGGITLLVDVAGGHGEVLLSILRAYSGMRGVLFDLDRVVAGAVRRIEAMGLGDRCPTASGDFFEGVRPTTMPTS